MQKTPKINKRQLIVLASLQYYTGVPKPSETAKPFNVLFTHKKVIALKFLNVLNFLSMQLRFL